MFKATGEEYYAAQGKTVYEVIRYFVEKECYHIVYPHEMVVHGLVDLACINPFSEEMYAFEIKEKGDSISTGIEQCKNYQSAFDYTYIVGAVKPKKESLLRMEQLRIGYVWIKFKEYEQNKVHCLCIAPLNHPMPKLRDYALEKFRKYSDYGKKKKQKSSTNTLDNYIEK